MHRRIAPFITTCFSAALACNACAVSPSSPAATSASPQSAPAVPEECRDVPIADILRNFSAAFSADFEISGNYDIAYNQYKEPYLLIAARPRKEGFFVIRCDYHIAPPAKPLRFEPDTRTDEYRILIGKTGQKRLLYEIRAYPAACAGDTLMVPISIYPKLSQHHFFSESQIAKAKKNGDPIDLSRIYREIAATFDDLPAQYKKDPDIVNQAAPQIDILGVATSFMRNAISNSNTAGTSLLLEAAKPGDVTIEAHAANHPFKDLPLHCSIMPARASITLTLSHVDRIEGSSGSANLQFPNATSLALRVGDRLTLSVLNEIVTNAGRDNYTRPAITLSKTKPAK